MNSSEQPRERHFSNFAVFAVLVSARSFPFLYNFTQLTITVIICLPAPLQVIHHDSQKLGRSKEEFLEINGPQMATATHVIVLVTEAASSSPFVFQEVLFADWLGKKLVSAVFKNVWFNLRPSMKAVLGKVIKFAPTKSSFYAHLALLLLRRRQQSLRNRLCCKLK